MLRRKNEVTKRYEEQVGGKIAQETEAQKAQAQAAHDEEFAKAKAANDAEFSQRKA